MKGDSVSILNIFVLDCNVKDTQHVCRKFPTLFILLNYRTS